jgi:D-3-phosphoglycerate dehydrogenase
MDSKTLFKLNILHLEKSCYPKETLQRLEENHSVMYLEANDQSKLIEFLRHHPQEAVFVRLGMGINAQVLTTAKSLKYVVTPTTGLNHIDLDTCKNLSIKVISLKGETDFLQSITSTSEHTWMLLLALIRNLNSAYQDVLRGFWRRQPFMALELLGKTLGIVGYGRLGKIVASYGLAFGMKVLVYEKEKVIIGAKSDLQQASLDEVLSKSDFLSLHIPGDKENHHFLDQEKIEKMKAGAMLINTSRGEVIDEKALLSALQRGLLAGAALDVLEGDSSWEEKSFDHHGLLQYAQQNSNLLLTPHMGGYGRESIFRTRKFITEKFFNALSQ